MASNSGTGYQRGTTAEPSSSRRVLAQIAPQVQALTTSPGGPLLNQATLTTAIAGTNNDLTYTATQLGTPGNSVTITYVVAGVSTPLSVTVAGNAITVNVATNAGSAATSTATQVRDAVRANAAAAQLVGVDLAAGNDGTGVVAAMGATPLAGGTSIAVGKPGNAPLPTIPPIHFSYR
jgi:hypothetical protein